jgi:hypothetical protein
MLWAENLLKGIRGNDDFHDRLPVRVFSSMFNIVGNFVLLFPVWAVETAKRLAQRGFESWSTNMHKVVNGECELKLTVKCLLLEELTVFI